MKKLIVVSLLLILSKLSISQLVTSTNYDELDAFERKFLQKFSLDSFNTIKNYKDTTWHIQEVNDSNLLKIFAKNDTTILFFYKPTCYDYDNYFKKIKKQKKDFKEKLVVVSESYYLGSIQSTFVEFKYNKQSYVIDKSYGKNLQEVKSNFCKSLFKGYKSKFDSIPFFWVDRYGNIIKTQINL